MAKTKVIVLCLLAVTAATHFLLQAKGQARNQPADAVIGGVWELTFTNKRTGILTIIQNKQDLKVTLKLQEDIEPINGTGTVKADVAEWTLTLTSPRRTVHYVFRAKVEGEKMSGDARIGNAGTTKWIASKKKPPVAAVIGRVLRPDAGEREYRELMDAWAAWWDWRPKRKIT